MATSIYVACHGNNVCDEYGSKAKKDVAELLDGGYSVTDDRSLVQHLAMKYKNFKKASSDHGVWAGDEYFVGHLSDEVLKTLKLEHHRPFKGSKKSHFE